MQPSGTNSTDMQTINFHHCSIIHSSWFCAIFLYCTCKCNSYCSLMLVMLYAFSVCNWNRKIACCRNGGTRDSEWIRLPPLLRTAIQENVEWAEGKDSFLCFRHDEDTNEMCTSYGRQILWWENNIPWSELKSEVWYQYDKLDKLNTELCWK